MAVPVDSRLARSGRATVTALALPLALAVSTSTKFRSGELGATRVNDPRETWLHL